MHTMILVREHEGLEEWACSACSRRMLVSWSPQFKRTVLDAGDPAAGHSGFKSKVQSTDGTTLKLDESSSCQIEIDESRLTPWSRWMKDTGFKDRWDDHIQ